MRDLCIGQQGVNLDGVNKTAEAGAENDNNSRGCLYFALQEADSHFDLFFVDIHVYHLAIPEGAKDFLGVFYPYKRAWRAI